MKNMKKIFILFTLVILSACSPQKISDAVLVDLLKQKARNLQDAILTRNLEEFNKYVDANIPFSSGESNLSEFIEMSPDRLIGENLKDSDGNYQVRWNALDLYDINVSLSPDSQTAVLTFYARGEYIVYDFLYCSNCDDADFTAGDEVLTWRLPTDPIKYSTRASSVWISTKNGWKIMHSNWAPFDGGTGIPKLDLSGNASITAQDIDAGL